MKMQTRTYFRGGWGQGFLRWVNLRPEESERTLLMFAFYTTTSIGLLWLETSATALFLDKYGAELLPVIYIASSGLGSGLGFFYSRLQKTLPLRSVLVAIAIFMGLPLFLFRVGLQGNDVDGVIVLATVFLLRLWMDATTVLNDLNTSITANQLFNIREIKRTYPLISSGLLVADVISGFSLPFLLVLVSLQNIIIMAGIMMLLGAGILFYLTRRYQHSFPDAPMRNLEDLQPEFKSRRVGGTLQRYVIPLFAFFILGQVLFLVVEFQYLSELERNLDASAIAGFLGIFSGILGLFELATQWFLSSRLIERLGVFVAAMLLPISVVIIGAIAFVAATFFPPSISILGLITLTRPLSLFIGVVCLKFIDELLRYTLIASTGAVLFQPLPESLRGSIQAMVRGIAETLSTGVTGVGILGIIGLCYWAFPNLPKVAQDQLQGNVFVGIIILVALGWLLTAWLLRSSYVNLLVQSAEQGRLGFSDVDLRAFKRAVIEVLEQPGKEGDKRSCIQLLSQIDPQNTGEVLAPLLSRFTPSLQRQSLEVILERPNPDYLKDVQDLITQQLSPEVLALALRYIWLAEPELDISSLKPYLRPEVDPTVRGTAAALILRRGNSVDKAEATNTLRRMLTHKRERERVMGCRALGEADYLQALRVYVADLLQDESLRVRCALLEVIGSTRQEEYYPSLVRGLHYKSTREAASRALVKLGDEAIPLLSELAEDNHKPDLVRFAALNAIATIGTPAALNQLTSQLIASWGTTRRNLLRILLKMPGEIGIEAVLDRLGRSGVETFIEQELLFLGQIYAAQVDLEQINAPALTTDLEPDLMLQSSQQALELLQRALLNLESDVIDRCFLLMKFLYPIGAIQAASFNLKSDSRSNIAVGLEILDNTVDLPTKRALLGILDQHPSAEKLEILAEILPYKPMAPSDRLRRLLELRYFLSEWTLACCFHLARAAHWSLTPEQTLVCLRHPTGFVREAVLAYLKEASPRALQELLPVLKNDPDQIVAAQVQQMMVDLSN
ncbi:MAG: Npt1/Npt2 family nucleotide transporter [Crinalium sp.]